MGAGFSIMLENRRDASGERDLDLERRTLHKPFHHLLA